MKSPEKLNWPTIIYLIVLHLCALTAPFCFTWSGLGLFIILSAITGMSVTLGFHRLLTHRSFETYPWFRRLLAFTGGLAGEGGAIMWVADHRKHHQFTDRDGDPHSPRDGFAWAHTVWTFSSHTRACLSSHRHQYARDLLKDPVLRFLDRTFIIWHFLLGTLLFAAGGWSWLVWGLFLRMIFVMHATWFVNSATHRWGYRNFITDDDSTNLWWVAMLTFGEGWHNNHHAQPTTAKHGLRWWEIDPTYMLICLLEQVGLIWKVVR